mmetsp:Transcript_87332/g.170864  ORF Transcript_87332/g.170864 Transcript_87332/m.170864 type:complete len:83 (-) Transcript_87332:81-329(-)
MVFKGQDAWRRHPLLLDCHKKPFPAFGTAVKIFAAFLVLDCYVKYVTAPPTPVYKPSVKYAYAKDDTFQLEAPIMKKIRNHH